MSLPEVVLCDYLRAGRLEGLRLQAPASNRENTSSISIVRRAKLAVEVDGAHHDHPGAGIYRDRVGMIGWQAQGVRVMRDDRNGRT